MSLSSPAEASIRPPQSALRAVGWMIGSALTMTSMALLGRAAAHDLSTGEIMFYRSAISLPIIAAIALFTPGGIIKLVTRRMSLHLARNTVHFAAQYGWFYAITVAPLAHVFALEFTMPLWIALLAPILIGERLTVPRAIAALLGFIGVLIVVRPHESSISAGTLAILAAACLYAFSVIWVRSLTRTERPIQILFWMTLIQTGLGILINIHDLHLPPQSAWGFLLLIAIAGLAAHYFMARAFALADTMVVMPIDFLRLPLAAGLGALIYGEGLDPWVLAGGALIILGNYWNLKAEHRTRTRK